MDIIMDAVHFLENNQADKAIALLEGHLPLADVEEKHTIAELYIQWGFFEKASVILTDLLRQYPNDSELKLMLAEIYTELEHDETAIDLLNDIRNDDPLYMQALIQLADLYQSQGLFEVAEQKLLTAKQLEPNEIIIDFALGELLFSLGDYKKAITYLEKVYAKASEMAGISVIDRLAESYASIGEYEKALVFYQNSENNNPDSLFKYGFTANHANRNDIAIEVWERLMDIDPYYHSVYYYLAAAYKEEELVEKAYETAEKGIQMDAFNKELYFYAGSLAHHLNMDMESEKWIREAIALDPDYKEAILFLIEFFKERGNFSDIVDLLTEIKHTGASDPIYDWELARAYHKDESYQNALKYYQRAYNSLNEDGDFLKEYGYFLTEEGKVADAILIFEMYLKQRPIDTDVEEYMERLKQIKET